MASLSSKLQVIIISTVAMIMTMVASPSNGAPVLMAAPNSNVCNMDYFLCPRDPGCVTYTMSVHDVAVDALNYTTSVKAEDLKAGDVLTVYMSGLTTRKTFPSGGSYRIYALNGKNLAAGTLTSSLTLNPPNFSFETTFTVLDSAIGPDGFFEFGVDVFQDAGGSDEAFCMEFSSLEYIDAQKAKPSPPFEDYCVDNGDGTYTKKDFPIVGKRVPSPPCGTPPPPPSTCEMYAWLCPRDPGCKETYDVSVVTAGLDVVGKPSSIKPGDQLYAHVNGTTSLTGISPSASYRIYSLSGKNVAAGVLGDVATLYNCGDQGCHIGLVVPFTAPDDCFSSEGWFSFTIDTFQEKYGSDEAFCLTFGNADYLHYEQTNSPPPGFVTYCKDEGWGKYSTVTSPEVVHDVECQFH